MQKKQSLPVKQLLEENLCNDSYELLRESICGLFEGISFSLVALFLTTNQSFIPNHILFLMLLSLLFCLTLVFRKTSGKNILFFFPLLLIHLPYVSTNYFKEEFQWIDPNLSHFHFVVRLILLIRFIGSFISSIFLLLIMPSMIKKEKELVSIELNRFCTEFMQDDVQLSWSKQVPIDLLFLPRDEVLERYGEEAFKLKQALERDYPLSLKLKNLSFIDFESLKIKTYYDFIQIFS